MIRVNMRDLEEELIAVFMSINKGMTMSADFNEDDSTNIRKWYWHWSILMLEYSKIIYFFYINIVCFRGNNLHLFVVDNERDQYLDDG